VPQLSSFDLVVATVGRVGELGRLLASLERQTHDRFRVLLVDQNEDGRLDPLLSAARPFEVLRLRAPRGLSRARNVALAHVQADLVAFPDDDCEYPEDLLERVARRFAAHEGLAGLTGRSADGSGHSSPSWKRDPAVLTPDNLWNRAISYAIFLRRVLVERLGSFDERLGLGAGTAWSSGEEIDYLVRAVKLGARIEYDPELVVLHEQREPPPSELRALGYRDGASVGYILRRNAYPARTIGQMLARPLGGVALALARADLDRARFHAATLRGRLVGLARAAK
jgi:glycosyltransferase involved in cell wall biosynthesis